EKRDVEIAQVRRLDGEEVDPWTDNRHDQDDEEPELLHAALIRVDQHPHRERQVQDEDQRIILDQVEEEVHTLRAPNASQAHGWHSVGSAGDPRNAIRGLEQYPSIAELCYKPVQKYRLVRVNSFSRFVERQKSRLVDLP